MDALDEAASDRDRRQIAEALAELAVLPGLRVAVATRPLAAGNPYAPGGLLPALGVTARDDPNLVDLDSDTYFDLDGLRQFAAALLAQDGMDHPGPPGAAWTQYRDQPAVRDRLAAVIAERAGRNFLVAAMAAVPLSTARGMADPAARGFDPADIPSGVGEALGKYLDQLPEQRRERDRALLTALAYARGAGLDDPAWLAFAAALGYSATRGRSRRPAPFSGRRLPAPDHDPSTAPVRSPACSTRRSPTNCSPRGTSPATKACCSTCSSARPGGPAGRTATCANTRPSTPAPPAGSISSWRIRSTWSPSIRPGWCPTSMPHDPPRRGPPPPCTGKAPTTSLALDRPARASQLELTAHQLGYRSLAARIADAAPDRPWQTRWSHGRRATGQQVLTGHDGAVSAVAVGALPDGTPVIVSGGGDGTVRVWRLADGTPVGEPLRGHADWVTAVAVGALPDGTPVIVSGSGGDDGHGAGVAAGRRHPGRGAAARPRRRGERGGGRGAAGWHPGHRQRRHDGTVRVWRLADGIPVGEPLADKLVG